MTQEPRGDSVARDIFRALFRHKLAVCLCFFLFFAGAVLWNIFWPSTYRSEGLLLVRLGRENTALDPTVTLGKDQMISVPMSRENEINSVVETLQSRVLVDKVIDEFGPARILDEAKKADKQQSRPAAMTGFLAQADQWKQWVFTRVLAIDSRPRERAIRKVTKSFHVYPMPKSNVIGVGYDSPDPKLSQEVLAKMIDVFQEQHAQANRPSGALEFFNQQAVRLAMELDYKEEEIRQLKRDTGLASPSDRRKILEDRVGRMEDELVRGRAEVAAAEAAAKRLAAQLASLPATELAGQVSGIGDEGTNRMRDRFYELQLAMEEMRSRYTDAHPSMQKMQRQVAAAQELLDKEQRTRDHLTTAPAKAYEQVRLAQLTNETLLASLRTRLASSESDLAEGRRQLESFNDTDLRIAKLEREREIREASYRKYCAALEESRIDKALETQGLSNISVIQPATYNLRPYRPRRLLNLLIGVVGGLFAGFAMAVLLEYADHSFVTANDVERQLRIPTLAEIPKLRSRQLRRLWR